MKKSAGSRSCIRQIIAFFLVISMLLSLCNLSTALALENSESPQIVSVQQISPEEMRDGGYYVLAVAGMDCFYGGGTCAHPGHTAGAKTYAMDAENSTYPAETGLLLDHEEYDGSVEKTLPSLIWQYEEYDGGVSLRSYSAEGENAYLSFAIDGSRVDLKLGPQQALRMEEGAKPDTINIAYDSYWIYFTSGSGSGYKADTKDYSNDFMVYEVAFDKAPETNPQIVSVQQISPEEMRDGGYYVLAVAGMDCFYGGGTCAHPGHTAGAKTYAMDAENSTYPAETGLLLDHEEYDGSVEKTLPSLIWQYEEYDGGVSLRSYSAEGENAYLSFAIDGSRVDLKLGPQQALRMEEGAKPDTINIAYDSYWIYFTSGSGSGYKADTKDYSNDFMVYEVTFEETEIVETLDLESLVHIDPCDMHKGGYYVLAVEEMDCFYGGSTCIHPGHTAGAKTYAMASNNTAYTGENGLILDHEEFNGSARNVRKNMVWQYEEFDGGASFRAYSAEGENAYLNFAVNGSHVDLKLGPQQAVQIVKGDNPNTINIANAQNYIYFTADYGSGYRADTKDYSNNFVVYEVILKGQSSAGDQEEKQEEPLYTIAAVTDMHIGYGDNPYVLRKGTLDALNTIRQKEKPDIVLSGGDMIGYNGQDKWTKQLYDKAIRELTGALSATSQDGKVLYVNGNHDYEPSYQKSDDAEYNSGAYIDKAMRDNLGEYTDVLYEDEDRKSNLLAYYYKIDGIHYIGLNTPYDGDNTVGDAIYPIEEIEWVEKTLKTIPQDDLIIVLAHYPLENSKGASKWMSNANGASTRLVDVMRHYPNLVYLYGHDHGFTPGTPFIEYSTFERVTPYRPDGSVEADRATRAGGFTSSFMGSLSYYMNRYNPGWLGDEQPKVIQALMLYIYEDHVVLQMKNYGEKTGIRQYPTSYTIPLKKYITSSIYDIDQENQVISGVHHNTLVSTFLEGFDEDIRKDLRVIDFDGSVITDTDTREIRSNMKVQYVINGSVMAELTVCVDRTAISDMPYTVESVTMQNEEAQTVYAMRNAQSITSITIKGNEAGGSAAGIAFVGIYDKDGQMLRCALTEIQGSGTYPISLSLEKLPDGSTWRAVVYTSMASMEALSYPLTSDAEHYVLPTLADSEETELVLGGDQKGGKLVVYHQGVEDWNEPSSIAWKWTPTKDLGFDEETIRYYQGSVSDAKLRYSDFYGGYVVITCSGNAVCLLDYETGESLFSTPYLNNNLHAIELLPDGNLVVAGSSGNSITLFAASQGDVTSGTNNYMQKYTSRDAHGLLWDPDLQVLWALGLSEITAYQMAGTPDSPVLVQQDALATALPSTGGHDLYPVYGEEDLLWISTESALYQFNTDTCSFTVIDTVSAAGIKSVGNQPYSGTIVRTVADEDNSYQVWCTDTIELFVPQPDGSYQHIEKVVSSDAYYKARVWHYKYQ